MTKTEYREYIGSPEWQKRRKEILRARPFCERCFLPRALSVRRGVYDQDLHVHHRNYSRVGTELDSDLEVLCPRCHEVETFGSSAKEWSIPEWVGLSGDDGLKQSFRSIQSWLLILLSRLNAETSDERRDQFITWFLGFMPSEIDVICGELSRMCIAWPVEADYVEAKIKTRDQLDLLARAVQKTM